MYLYRAVNETDEQKILAGQPLCAVKYQPRAYTPDGGGYLQTAMDHVLNGAREKHQHCWISLAANPFCCMEEYSVPQTGGYNTAVKRKRIAVFDVSRWKKAGEQPGQSDSCTFFMDKQGRTFMDFMWLKKSHLPKGSKGKSARLQSQIRIFVYYMAGKAPDASTGLLDCGMPTCRDRGGDIVTLDRLSLFEMAQKNHYGVVLMGPDFNHNVKQGNAVASGSAKAASEALALNYIPAEACVRLLSFPEIDFLSAAGKEQFSDALQAMIAGKLNLSVQNGQIMLNNRALTFLPSNAADYFGDKTCVDIAAERFRENPSNSDIEALYADALAAKRCIMGSIFQAAKNMGLDFQYADRVLEDNAQLWVKSLANNEPLFVKGSRSYDLLAVQRGQELYTGRDILNIR